MKKLKPLKNLDEWNLLGKDCLPGHMGLEIVSVLPDTVTARMQVKPKLCAPNGFLHAASIIALADTACGYAAVNNLPEDAEGFTTIELKTNFIGTALEGRVVCIARLLHKGRTTQVWDAEVRAETTGKAIAFFRCTQMILWPRKEKEMAGDQCREKI